MMALQQCENEQVSKALLWTPQLLKLLHVIQARRTAFSLGRTSQPPPPANTGKPSNLNSSKRISNNICHNLLNCPPSKPYSACCRIIAKIFQGAGRTTKVEAPLNKATVCHPKPHFFQPFVSLCCTVYLASFSCKNNENVSRKLLRVAEWRVERNTMKRLNYSELFSIAL